MTVLGIVGAVLLSGFALLMVGAFVVHVVREVWFVEGKHR